MFTQNGRYKGTDPADMEKPARIASCLPVRYNLQRTKRLFRNYTMRFFAPPLSSQIPPAQHTHLLRPAPDCTIPVFAGGSGQVKGNVPTMMRLSVDRPHQRTGRSFPLTRKLSFNRRAICRGSQPAENGNEPRERAGLRGARLRPARPKGRKTYPGHLTVRLITMFSLSQAGATPGEGLQLAMLVGASLAPAIKLTVRLYISWNRRKVSAATYWGQARPNRSRLLKNCTIFVSIPDGNHRAGIPDNSGPAAERQPCCGRA